MREHHRVYEGSMWILSIDSHRGLFAREVVMRGRIVVFVGALLHFETILLDNLFVFDKTDDAETAAMLC